jgi:hypothetical protein
VVDVLRIDEVSETLDILRSEVEDWWEDIVIVLLSKMEGSKRLLCLLLKGVGSCGSDVTILVVVVVGVNVDVVWRVELGMKGSCGFLICAVY